MRDFADVTEDQVKAIFNADPACNQYMTWEEVKGYEPMYRILQMRAADESCEKVVDEIAAQQEKNRALCGIPSKPKLAIVKNDVEKTHLPVKTAKVIVIGKTRADKIAHALCLARNCLQSGAVNDSLRNEALRELSEVQQFLKPPQHGKK